MNNMVWTTKDGDDIPVSKMSDSHIKNCIRMLRDGGCSHRDVIDALSFSPPNGDMACDAFYDGFDYMLENEDPWIDIFEDELRRREVKK